MMIDPDLLPGLAVAEALPNEIKRQVARRTAS
jgi:hypothetical protein